MFLRWSFNKIMQILHVIISFSHRRVYMHSSLPLDYVSVFANVDTLSLLSKLYVPLTGAMSNVSRINRPMKLREMRVS